MKKKFVFILSTLVCLTSCRQQTINADFIARSTPIMPVRMNADTMTILLTDYVPAFFGGKQDKWVSEMV